MAKREPTDDLKNGIEDGAEVKTKAQTPSRLRQSSNDLATNLLIADIVVRGASTLFRQSVEKRLEKANPDDVNGKQEPIDGRTLITTLGLYGASKLATRSVPGLVAVGGGLVFKALYDRGKARQRRLARKPSDD